MPSLYQLATQLKFETRSGRESLAAVFHHHALLHCSSPQRGLRRSRASGEPFAPAAAGSAIELESLSTQYCPQSTFAASDIVLTSDLQLFVASLWQVTKQCDNVHDSVYLFIRTTTSTMSAYSCRGDYEHEKRVLWQGDRKDKGA